MGSYQLHTADTAHWRALVTAAECRTECRLHPDVEGYLVMLLLRYARLRQAGQGLGMQIRNHKGADGDGRIGQLREMGDKCLVFTGLLTEEARRSGVPLVQFVEAGRSAYRQIAEESGNLLFARLSDGFVALMDVLQAMRQAADAGRPADLLALHEQWSETGSRHAFRRLCAATGALPLPLPSLLKH